MVSIQKLFRDFVASCGIQVGKKKIGLMNVTLFHTHLLIVFDIFAYLVRYIPR